MKSINCFKLYMRLGPNYMLDNEIILALDYMVVMHSYQRN